MSTLTATGKGPITDIDWTCCSLKCKSLDTSPVNDNTLKVCTHIQCDGQFPEISSKSF